MKKHFYISFLILNAILFNPLSTSAQQTNNTEQRYTTFDKLVGYENTSLYQGRLYIEKYRTINNRQQFFKSIEFIIGDVWYKGQPYFNQLLKYDVYEDELLLKLEESENILTLSKKDIDSFSLGKDQFVNLKLNTLPLESFGYHKVLFQDYKFTLYAKYHKNIWQLKDDNYAYYEFTDAKTKYVLLYDGDYYILNSKKDIISAFPNHKKEIKKLYNNAKKRHKKDSDAIMTTVVRQLESII